MELNCLLRRKSANDKRTPILLKTTDSLSSSEGVRFFYWRVRDINIMKKFDVKSVIAQVKKEYWDWQLSKPDEIPKPTVYRLPLISIRASYNDVAKKYPVNPGWKTIHHLYKLRARFTDPRPWWDCILTVPRGSLHRLGPRRKR